MPGRSPPWTVSTHDVRRPAPVPRSSRHLADGHRQAAVGGERRERGLDLGGGGSPAQTSIIAKWPRSSVIVESSRLRPSPARPPVASAMMPGRSWPRTVMAWRVTSGAFSQRRRPAEDLVQHRLGELAGERVLLAGVVGPEEHDVAVRRGEHRLRAVAEARLGPRHPQPSARNARSAASQPYDPSATTTRTAARRVPISRSQPGRRCRAPRWSACSAGGAHRTAAAIRVATQPLAVAGVGAGGPGGEADPVQAREQPVAGPVPGEDAPGAVAAVGGRRQPDDQHPRRRRRPSRRSDGPSTAGRRTPPACRATSSRQLHEAGARPAHRRCSSQALSRSQSGAAPA